MKKIILLLCIFLLSGCSDYIEINDLSLVSGIKIDYVNDEFVLNSALVINEEKSTLRVYETHGKSIEEALLEVSKLSNKELFISHLKILLVTKRVIENNVNFYDYFLRNPKLKMNFHVYVVDDGAKVFDVYKKDNSSALYIDKMLKFNNEIYSSSTPLSFIDLVSRELEFGIDNIYPTISVLESNDQKSLYLDNLVFFNNENKEVHLNDEDGIFYNLIINKLENSSLNINCDDSYFSLTIDNKKTKLKYKNNKFYIDININGKLNVYKCVYDIDENNTIKILNDLTNEYIGKRVKNLIDLSKKNDTDFIGFGNYIYKYTKIKNNDYLKDLDVVINVKTNINSIGEKRK